ncbi:MAG: biotin--[acetyl-CoA-carboxylase] ligase [Kutzneria sp.]|nr:biotin--[acetyl-CoA-carboxylase] ligase [Kutzneria sp.]MBV9845756.1 biotin--[acetyl-CoA-carboxylase] ligase [Kutzneria sp.]
MSNPSGASNPPGAKPLDVQALRARLVVPAGPYSALDVVSSTGSTNADLHELARAGAEDRTVLIAERQTAGRGRRARDWVSPPAVGLYVSTLLRPDGIPPNRLPLVSLLAGVALVRTARTTAGVDAVLKWPNDLLAGPQRAKCAGVLAETSEGGVVLGMGINVHPLPADAVPRAGEPAPTSLAEQGATTTDRTELAVALLLTLSRLDARWRLAYGDAVACGLLDTYREYCATLGMRVRVELPGDRELVGTAVDIDREGRIVVHTDGAGRQAVYAGDVVHLRPAAGQPRYGEGVTSGE